MIPRRATDALTRWLIVLLALCAAWSLAAAAARFPVRLDATMARTQRLAPRTTRVLDRAAMHPGTVEVIIAADFASIDRAARRDVDDVLALVAARGVAVSTLDVGTPRGMERHAELIRRLVDRERDEIDAQLGVLQAAADSTSALATWLDQALAPALEELPEVPAADGARPVPWAEWAAAARVGARRTLDAAREASDLLGGPETPQATIAPLDSASALLREALSSHVGELIALQAQLEACARAHAQSGAAGLARGVEQRRAEAATEADRLARLPRLDISRVAEALRASQVALVIGPEGLAGVELASLYTPRRAAEQGGTILVDVRAQTEDLLGNAIASVLDPRRPIVVLVHGESARVLDRTRMFQGVFDRLALRGVDVVEWAPVIEPEPVALRALAHAGARPTVFVTLAPDSSASARTSTDLPGPDRASAYGRALARILAEEHPVLVGVNPSIIPGTGSPDPASVPLEAIGVRAATGGPLLRRVATESGEGVEVRGKLLPGAGEHPIGRSIEGLPTTLPWMIPLRVTPATGWRASVLLECPRDDATWSESEWVAYWRSARRDLLPDKPRFDEGRDARDGPWPVALALEHEPSGARAVVVGSNGWFADPLASSWRSVDGRLSLESPGNAELFEASVMWLSGQDDLMAQSSNARSVPLVRAIEPGMLSVLRWGLSLGLPVLALIVGALWRAIGG